MQCRTRHRRMRSRRHRRRRSGCPSRVIAPRATRERHCRGRRSPSPTRCCCPRHPPRSPQVAWVHRAVRIAPGEGEGGGEGEGEGGVEGGGQSEDRGRAGARVEGEGAGGWGLVSGTRPVARLCTEGGCSHRCEAGGVELGASTARSASTTRHGAVPRPVAAAHPVPRLRCRARSRHRYSSMTHRTDTHRHRASHGCTSQGACARSAGVRHGVRVVPQWVRGGRVVVVTQLREVDADSTLLVTQHVPGELSQ